ncbi:hypothetical protein AVEN_30054-1 [Araneus ventricosus]|uniref:HAT C-terminal dimerisation domain-containing protein n=1 Tax=Araneus ventricosus TaxID=182803 RepID=A0A4Y2I7C7_ARAVE|nr:hypothetical protein AVEN_30054-1 [Araneus ventricosus]
MKCKFPFESDIVLNAEVADINSIVDASFASVKVFACLLTLQRTNFDRAVDSLQNEFCAFQMDDLPYETKEEKNIDIQWSKVGKLMGLDGKLKYEIISKVMIGILTIPHSNAECEWIFSLVTKIPTKFRSSLSNQILGNLLTVKSRMQEPCFNGEFDVQFLKRAKSATTSSLKE